MLLVIRYYYFKTKQVYGIDDSNTFNVLTFT
jgi:hypothetical protein